MSDESFEALEAALFGDDHNSVYSLANENARLRNLLQDQQHWQARSCLPSPPLSPSTIIDFRPLPQESDEPYNTRLDWGESREPSTEAKRHASEISALRARMETLAEELEKQRVHEIELCGSRREGEVEWARLRTVVATGTSSREGTPTGSSTPRRTNPLEIGTILSSNLPPRLQAISSSSPDRPSTSSATFSSSPVRVHPRPLPIDTKIGSIVNGKTSSMWESKETSLNWSPAVPRQDELGLSTNSMRSVKVSEDDQPFRPCVCGKKESTTTSQSSRTQDSDLPPLPSNEDHVDVEENLLAKILILENRLAESEEGRLASDFCAQSLRDFIASQSSSTLELPFVSSRSRWGSGRRPSNMSSSSSSDNGESYDSSTSEPSTPTHHLPPRRILIPPLPSSSPSTTQGHHPGLTRFSSFSLSSLYRSTPSDSPISPYYPNKEYLRSLGSLKPVPQAYHPGGSRSSIVFELSGSETGSVTSESLTPSIQSSRSPSPVLKQILGRENWI